MFKGTFPFSLFPPLYYSKQEEHCPKSAQTCTSVCLKPQVPEGREPASIETSPPAGAPCPAYQRTKKAIQIYQGAALSPVKVNSYLWPQGQGPRETHGQLQWRQGWVVTQKKCLLCLPQAMKEVYKLWIVRSPACNIQITKQNVISSVAELRTGNWWWQI